MAKKFKEDSKTKERRRKVVSRLEEQLKSGKKTVKKTTEDLTPSDINRINKELEILSHRL